MINIIFSLFNYCFNNKKQFNRNTYFKDNFKLINLIQTNKYVDVCKVQYKNKKNKKNNKYYVVKILSIHYNLINDDYELLLYHEYNILKKLDHNNIIKPIDYIPKFGIIFNYIESKELYYLVKNNQLTLYNKIKIFNKLLDVFKYLHTKNIFHLDIKLENILIDENYQPILIDFGSSTNNYLTNKFNNSTFCYYPPEIHKYNTFNDSLKYDSWCFGLIVLSFINTDYFYLWLNNTQTFDLYAFIQKKIKDGIFTNYLHKLWVWDIHNRELINNILPISDTQIITSYRI